MHTDSELISEWRLVRFQLFQALDSLSCSQIYLIEQANNVLTVCVVLNDVERLRPLVRMRMIDTLVELHAPDLYRRYLWLWEVWSNVDWGRQLVSKVLARKALVMLP